MYGDLQHTAGETRHKIAGTEMTSLCRYLILLTLVAMQNGGEPGPTGRILSSLGRFEDATTDRPGYIIASGRLGETHDFKQKVWNVGGVTLMIAPNQIPGDLRLRELNGRVVEIIVREVQR